MRLTVFNVHMFVNGRLVETAKTYDEALTRCIRLYEASGKKISYFVKAVA